MKLQLQQFIFLIYLVVLCLCFTGTAGSQSITLGPATSQPKMEKPMKFNKVTPNLIVADMEKSLRFYRDILGFTVSKSVPDKAPFIFAWMKRSDADIFLNQHMPPQPGQPDLFAGKPIGG